MAPHQQVMVPFSSQLARPQAQLPIKPIRDVSHEVLGVANHKEHSERAAFLGPLTQLIKGRAVGSSPAFEGWSAWGNGGFCELSKTVTQLASIRLHAYFKLKSVVQTSTDLYTPSVALEFI